MPLVSWCPRCPRPVVRTQRDPDGGADPGAAADWTCEDHGVVAPLWRADGVAGPDYAGFAETLRRCGDLPTYLPWPMSPGWRVCDFGCVAGDGGAAVATMTTTAGSSSLDGDVEVTILLEEPGVGLGARVAGLEPVDPGGAGNPGSPGSPGDTVGVGPSAVRIRLDQRPVPMWSVPSGEGDDLLARSVFAGEAGGRWLWLVMRPASAALLLRDEWLFADAGRFGPEAVEIAFGGTRPSW